MQRQHRRRGTAPAGTEIHDDTALVLDHGRDKMPDDIGRALDVHINDIGEFLCGHFPKRRAAIDERGVVEEQIRRAVRGQNFFRPRGNLRIIRHVQRGKAVGARNCFCNAAISFPNDFNR